MNDSKIQVYRIDTYPAGSDSYAVDRSENWFLRKDRQFDTKEEAEQYIIEKSKANTELANFSAFIKEDKKAEFYHQFCFTEDRYASYRRYVTDPSHAKVIRNALRARGVRVSNS